MKLAPQFHPKKLGAEIYAAWYQLIFSFAEYAKESYPEEEILGP